MASRSFPMDWLLATDPAFSRARMGARVTLTIGLSVLVMVAIHLAVTPLPPIAFGLSIILSIEGGVAVRDTTPRGQLVTRLLGGAASLGCVGLAALLEDHRYVSDPVFLIVILASTLARVYGPRGFAIGMFSFTAYFMGAYLRPALDQLPLAALGPVVSVLVGHGVRTFLLPDHRGRDLAQALTALQARVDEILVMLAVLSRQSSITDADRRALSMHGDRLKDVALMAEGILPRPPDGALQGGDDPVTDLAIRIFDLHLAAESVIVLARRAPLPFGLVHALIGRDLDAVAGWERNAAANGKEAPDTQSEGIGALVWLSTARTRLAEAMEEGRLGAFAALDASAGTPAPGKPDFSLANPVVRMALQITLASAIAMVFGLMLSRDRWFWAVLTAFLVFTNTKSRGDAAVRALQRSIGTLLGIGAGLALASLLQGQVVASVALATIGIFLAFYWLQISYAVMTFFVSIVLCLIYGLIGSLTLDLLLLRIEETLIGAAAGTAVAFVVFPARTRDSVDEVLARWYGLLEDLLRKAREGGSGFALIETSRQLDAAYRDLATAARPLGTSWSIVTRPGHVRQTLAIYLAATYWARIFANGRSGAVRQLGDDDRQVLEDLLARIGAVAKTGADPFFRSDIRAGDGDQPLPVIRNGTRQGLRMIGILIGRLSDERTG